MISGYRSVGRGFLSLERLMKRRKPRNRHPRAKLAATTTSLSNLTTFNCLTLKISSHFTEPGQEACVNVSHFFRLGKEVCTVHHLQRVICLIQLVSIRCFVSFELLRDIARHTVMPYESYTSDVKKIRSS